MKFLKAFFSTYEAPCNGAPSSVKTLVEELVNKSGKMDNLNVIEAPCDGAPMIVETKKGVSIREREKKKDDSIVGEVHGGVIFDDQIVQEGLEMRRETVTEKVWVEVG